MRERKKKRLRKPRRPLKQEVEIVRAAKDAMDRKVAGLGFKQYIKIEDSPEWLQ